MYACFTGIQYNQTVIRAYADTGIHVALSSCLSLEVTILHHLGNEQMHFKSFVQSYHNNGGDVHRI